MKHEVLTTFDEIIDITLEHEGGYVHDPNDLGGETNFGIAGRFYPDVDIKNLTKDGAKEIYRKDYWDKNKIDDVSDGLKHIYFDMCVNQGRGTAVKILQRAINGKGGDLTVGNDFRQISLLKNPQNFGSDTIASATTLRARKSLVLAADQSLTGFAVDQLIVGGTSGAKAYLVQIDTSNKVLYYYQNAKTGYIPFVQGDAVTGTLPSGGSATLHQGSGTTWYGQSVNGYGPEVKNNSGQLIFLENRDPINRSSSQIEDIKLIVEF
jgi:hypothetical protein